MIQYNKKERPKKGDVVVTGESPIAKLTKKRLR